jgi:hypothetical protein
MSNTASDSLNPQARPSVPFPARALSLTAPLAACLLLAGCPEDPPPFECEPANVPAEIIVPSCGGPGASCHGTGSIFGLYGVMPELLLSTNASGLSLACADMPLVNPTLPADGVLFRKLVGTECGAQMPLGLPPLSAAQVECIRSWVTEQRTTRP